MKQFFTLVLVLFAFVAQAGRTESPFGVRKMSPQVEKLIKDSRVFLTDARLRTTASGFPDSAISYNWDGTAWEVETQVRINYTSFGKIASLIFYFDLGGTPIPVLTYQYTYDAAGRTTRIEQLQTIPGLPPVVATRFLFNYDTQGNQTSMLIYEDDGGTLALSEGDSLQITYAAGVPTTAIRYVWDTNGPAPLWMADTRFSNIAFGANNEPTALTISYWMNNAFVEEDRYTEVSWKMGYPGFSTTFGGLFDIGQFLFQELPIVNGLFGDPTDYIAELFDGTSWNLDSKVTSTGPAGAITQLLEQSRDNNSWVDSYRNTLSYTSGRLTLSLLENRDNSTWVPSDKNTWNFDSQGNLTLDKYEFYVNNNWEVVYADSNAFNYTADNKVFRWVGMQYDNMSMSYVNSLKRDYFFGSFPQSVVNQKLAELQVYPNPVQDKLNVSLESAANGKLSAEIFNLQGQLVSKEVFVLSPGKNLVQLEVQDLATGLYQLRLQTSNGLETVRFVK